MSRYAAALRRLSVHRNAERFYDVHVAIDEHHEIVACAGLVNGLVAAEPTLAENVVFSAKALLAMENRFARSLLAAWTAKRSSLRSRPTSIGS